MNSVFGSILSILLFITMSCYVYLKADVLIAKKDVDVLSTVNDLFFTYEDVISYENGFNFAVAFTAYDNDEEPILDPSYGEIVFNHFKWGTDAEENYFYERARINSTHTCTPEELGLDTQSNETNFLPIRKENKNWVRKLQKKL